METNLYSINQLSKQIINGRHYDNKTLERCKETYNIQPKGKTSRGYDGYSLQDFEQALAESVIKSESNSSTTADGDDLIDLKKEKLRREIEAINKDNQKKDLQIEQLKSQLVDYDEAFQYLVARKALEAAILRRIFLTNMPIEVTGLNKSKAREKGESYFNEITIICNDTIKLWSDKFGGGESDLLSKVEKKVKEIFGIVDKKTNEATQAITPCDPSI